MIRAAITATTVAVALVCASVANAATPTANVTSVNYGAGNPFFDVTVAIPSSVDAAARSGAANWALEVTLTYVDVNTAVDSLDSGVRSLANDTLLAGTVNWRGPWDPAVIYGSGDGVNRNGSLYISNSANNLNNDPATNSNTSSGPTPPGGPLWSLIGTGAIAAGSTDFVQLELPLQVGPGPNPSYHPTATLIAPPDIHPSLTGVSCSPSTVAVGQSTTCTATVTDTASGGQTTPTGTVSFSSNGPGSFSGNQCTMSGSGPSASCSATYTPAPSGTPRSDTITATSSGDPTHTSSNGAATVTVQPTSKDDCKHGGYQNYGFGNQGQCIKFVHDDGG